MIHDHPSTLARDHAAHHDEEREGRRLSVVLVSALLVWSLGYIAWKLWVVETLGDRLERVAVSVQAPESMDVEVADLSVDRHQGPGESAYFDLIVHLRIRRGPGGAPVAVRVGATLGDEGKKPLLDLEPVQLTDIRPSGDRVHRLFWSPVPKPTAERARHLMIRVVVVPPPR